MPTSKQDREFGELMQPPVSFAALDSAIEWIQGNLPPESVFSESDLAQWAEENGYVKE